ncbi:hypothetical protein ACHHV8_31725 [Paenibacillus sp. TAB 01]|uniref:hypothetical protein n=1 Tax=Paenibacillus sp. TAB 01 TaxID=3368988 RepID=UPI003753E22D
MEEALLRAKEGCFIVQSAKAGFRLMKRCATLTSDMQQGGYAASNMIAPLLLGF